MHTDEPYIDPAATFLVVVTRTACEALREMGYPQDKAAWWYLRKGEDGSYLGGDGPEEVFLACPDAMTALNWLEQALGYEWSRTFGSRRGGYAAYYALTPGSEDEQVELAAGTPSDLILAVVWHWQQQHQR